MFRSKIHFSVFPIIIGVPSKNAKNHLSHCSPLSCRQQHTTKKKMKLNNSSSLSARPLSYRTFLYLVRQWKQVGARRDYYHYYYLLCSFIKRHIYTMSSTRAQTFRAHLPLIINNLSLCRCCCCCCSLGWLVGWSDKGVSHTYGDYVQNGLYAVPVARIFADETHVGFTWIG